MMTFKFRLALCLMSLSLGLAWSSVIQANSERAYQAIVDDDFEGFLSATKDLSIAEINQSIQESWGETLLITATRYHRNNIVSYLLNLDGICLECRDQHQTTALLEAVTSKNVEGLSQLIAAKANVNAQNENLVSGLMIAAARSSEDIFKILASHPQIDPLLTDANGSSVVHYLLELGENLGGLVEGNVEMEVLEDGAPIDVKVEVNVEVDVPWQLVIETLVRNKSDEALAEFLRQRAELDRTRLRMLQFFLTHSFKDKDAANNKARALTAENADGRRPLDYAAEFGMEGAIQFLADNGVELPAPHSFEAQQLLLLAINSGQLDPVRYLVDTHKVGVNFNFAPLENISPLHLASMILWQPDAIEFLIQSGADIENLCDQGLTPLMHASSMGNYVGVKCLLDHKANHRTTDPELKFSALSFAAFYTDCEQTAECLAKAGANLFHQDKDGDNLLHLALYRVAGSPVEGMNLIKFLIEKAPALLDQKNKQGLSPKDLAQELPDDLKQEFSSLLPGKFRKGFN
jgi:ankyrin repeat protein